MDTYDEKSQSFLANKRQFNDFISNEVDGVYQRRITLMIKNEETRLIVNVDDLRKFDPELARRVLETPMQYIAPFQSALKEYVLSLNAESGADPASKVNTNYTIGLDGNFGGQKVSPRELQAQHLGRLVCVEGIATRCSIVRPKVQRTVHYCEKTGVHSEMTYHDATSISGFPTSSIYPTKDLEGNPLTTEFGLSNYQDHQTLVIQEMPERAPAGLLPSSVDVVLDDDLVDQCKPGDRVAIIGIYRALPSKSQGFSSGIFRSILIANHVRHLGKNVGSNTPITPGDTGNIRKIAKRSDVFDLLGRSVAPSIFGHNFIKSALVLLLLGGVEKNLDNGTHIRGDINMLFVGDPGTAKSQLLRFILNIAPLALNTTGRGSSGVGLTAAVTQDKETGERRLEAGAMVLADRGVVCIDEFDKMSDADRVAIHEVMEQQTVTIAKAGIHMSLNARCSVVAAANPRYSQYDSTKPPNWNVNLPDSLLSRFDFLFIILDTPDPEHDRQIADKVLSNHRYVRRNGVDEENEVDYNAIRSDQASSEAQDTEVFQKFDRLLHGGLVTKGVGAKPADILSIPFMKKYIAYAKAQVEPVLTPEAAEFIGRSYAELRQAAMEGDKKEHSFPITARSLETLIRLSTAHAKARLDDQVTVHDCEQVLRILRYAIEHDAGVKLRDTVNGGNNDARRNRRDEGDDDSMADDDESKHDDDEDGGDAPAPRVRSTRSPTKRAVPAPKSPAKAAAAASPAKRKQPSSKTSTPVSKRGKSARASTREDAVDEEEQEDEEQPADEDMEDEAPAAVAASSAAVTAAPRAAVAAAPPSSARLADVQKHLVSLFKIHRVDFVIYKTLLSSLNAREDQDKYEEAELEAILKIMETQNKLMWRRDHIYKV